MLRCHGYGGTLLTHYPVSVSKSYCVHRGKFAADAAAGASGGSPPRPFHGHLYLPTFLSIRWVRRCQLLAPASGYGLSFPGKGVAVTQIS